MVWAASHRLGSTTPGATADAENGRKATRRGTTKLSNEPPMHTISESVSTPRTEGIAKTARSALVVGALGIVFGDIGTSPIYTVQTLFNPGDPHPVPISTQNVYGLVSLIFWSVMIIVTLTYVTLVMRADNNGEGGIMALITLVLRLGGRGRPAWHWPRWASSVQPCFLATA